MFFLGKNANKFDGWHFLEQWLQKCDDSLFFEKTTQTSLMDDFFLKSYFKNLCDDSLLVEKTTQTSLMGDFSLKSDLESVISHF